MKILAVADEEAPQLYEHFDPERFPKVDLILGCGDLRQRYLSYLMGAFVAPMYYVRGNHDTAYNRELPVGGEDIDGRIVEYKGIRIAGIEGSMWYGGGSLQYTDRQMRWKVWKMYPRLWRKSGVDIVIAHSPVKGCQDGSDPCHRGFSVFRDLIVRFRPRYFLHGHMHLNYSHGLKRAYKLADTWIINCSGYYLLDYDKGPDKRDQVRVD